MNRRQFAFWIGAGLFSLGERLRAETLDTLAAAVMQCTEKLVDGEVVVEQERWTYQQNQSWRWFERETLIDGQWELTGRTRPIHRRTGEAYTEHEGYLDDNLVPDEVRFGKEVEHPPHKFAEYDEDEDDYGEAAEHRRARDGRPPSKWLRSLYADELRLWLPEVDVPDVGVSGMTVWTHLTRDHGFDATRIKGLNDMEMAKLHSVAHYGY